ncbi:MAG: glycosyl transferase family 2 [Parcubacteria group bacterium RIFCSPHIGHO2_01_FULL_45_26]|uniref:Glycosyl transferase family 2 n=1 Tax=Candidatus Yanofskybacteria bacterium RIFCSPLOWO2_02_FULL_43_10b TaxID=1802704 RepID=A0A1F8H2U5_9BACT|nr:MAG: glycosyl transferase family 2 [Candidatus Yanofskybacteria bacterium RIFCSPLOWO2_02_FULL_43_10b]OHB17377.1 MAG: glycosyl transferase family 2 [Parcubacteria group bacterium RIFCSPHIGHO2_01_FULL_45_26]
MDNLKKINAKPKVIVVLPAYNAESTLEWTVGDISRDIVDEVILVDDNSRDKTIEIAKKLNLLVYKHEQNRGYGANQKTCYKMALQRGADIVVMLHPDYQYDPKLIKYFVNFIADGYFDVVLGSRIRSRQEALDGGMPFYKYLANRFLTTLENIVTAQNLSEWHTGMRAYKREVLERIDYDNNSNDFVFDTQMLFKIVGNGFSIGELSIPVRYFPEASSINFRKSVWYGLGTVAECFKYLLRKTVLSLSGLVLKER